TAATVQTELNNLSSIGGVAEVQTFTLSGSTLGTYTLTFNGQTTSPPLAFNSSAATVEAALNALSSIGGAGGNVTVTQSGSTFTVTFHGALQGLDLPQLT